MRRAKSTRRTAPPTSLAPLTQDSAEDPEAILLRADSLAKHGQIGEALALVRAGLVPDLLVTDHLMPGMSGAELARELGRQLPDLRSLVISGFAEEDGIDSNMARLNKPFRNDELVASLGNLRAPPTIEATLP